MIEIEKILMERKKDIDDLEVPDEMEERIKNVLNDIPRRTHKKFRIQNIIVVASIFVLIAAYNFDVLAYCGKTLLGYDHVMNGTLQELNNLGEGQKIGKSYTFKNGLKVSLDGIMVDGNQLIAFYRVLYDNKNAYESNHVRIKIKGFFREYTESSGAGEISDDGMEVKWVHNFEKPFLLEKKLHFIINFSENGYSETGDIEFKVDFDKAMGNTLKQKINKTVEADGLKIRIDSISASPTETIIYGTVSNTLKLVIEEVTGEKFRPDEFDMELMANGRKVENLGSGITTNSRGIKIESNYDALPSNLEDLKLNIKNFLITKNVDEKVVLYKDANNKIMKIDGKDVAIKKIYENSGETYIKISTEDDVTLAKVTLIIDGEKINLKETIDSTLEKTEEGKLIHNRTLRFPKSGGSYEFHVEKISYRQDINKIVDIPIK